MRAAPHVIVLTLGALLAGCETMSEDECRKADWLERGRRDGGRGEAETFIDAHRRACAKINVVPDDRRWRQGWGEGVRSYCVPRVAWRAGLDNRSYSGACQDLDEAMFLSWYRAGKDAYTTRAESDAKKREIDKLEQELKKAVKDDERKALRDKIRQLDIERGRLRRLLEVQLGGEPR